MINHKTTTREEWLKARRKLLKKEKELTRRSDELAKQRQELPWVQIDKEYRFETEEGRVSLAELFHESSQLIIYHFMFDPEWDKGCMSCSFVADNFAGVLSHLTSYDTSFAVISRASIAKIQRFKKRMGWDFPWLSSFGTDFNYDFQVTLNEQHTVYNYAPVSERPAHMQGDGEWPGFSVFVCDGERLFHTYSTYGRGFDSLLNTYKLLDLTPLGRQEAPHAPVGAKSAKMRAAQKQT